MCEFFNAKKLMFMLLMVLIVGTPLFGLKQCETKNDRHVCKTKSIKPQPEEQIIKLDPVVDKKIIKKKIGKTLKNNSENNQADEWLLIQEALKNLPDVDFGFTPKRIEQSEEEALFEKSLVTCECFEKYAKGQFAAEIAKNIRIEQIGNHYSLIWADVETWTDKVNTALADESSQLAYTYALSPKNFNIQMLEKFKTLVQGHYKIHIMPKDEKEGMRVILHFFNALKNNPDFRKYASAFKFLKNFSFSEENDKNRQMPVIVVYPVWGKENAQASLNVLFELLQKIDFVGSPIMPRYNCKLLQQGIFFAMSEGYLKFIGKTEFFDKEKNYGICSKEYFKSDKDYMLKLPAIKKEEKDDKTNNK